MWIFHRDADWDRVPGWIEAISAIIAAIGLVITLVLQRVTLKEQQKITVMEQEKFLTSYLPFLEIDHILHTESELNHKIIFNIIIRQNYLQKLTIVHNFLEDFKIKLPYILSNVILPANHKMSFKIEHPLFPEAHQDTEEYSENTIHFSFEDALGNKYEQVLIYTGTENLFLQPAFRIFE